MPSGGKRENTPPPPSRTGQKWASTLAKEAVRELVRQAVTAHMPELIDAQVAQARGLRYMVVRDRAGKFVRIPDGITPEALDALLGDEGAVVEVWTKDPSTPAFTDLMNRAIDKPKEQEQEIILTNTEEMLARLDAWKAANRATLSGKQE